METTTWVLGQVILDIVIFFLLVILLVNQRRHGITFQDFQSASEKSRVLVSEMLQISEALEENLKEKRELSRQLVSSLDNRVSKAEEASVRLAKLVQRHEEAPPPTGNPARDYKRLRASAGAMAAKGFSKKEIAGHLDVPMGELDLILRLKEPSGP
jgi:predicted RecB family endonuclease